MRIKQAGGLTVFVAVVLGTLLFAFAGSATARDRNDDSLPDRWEKKHGLSLHKKQTRRDQDRDKLRNRGEFKADMDPRDADSDDDGIEDGDENAGVIASFDSATGLLTIDAFRGPDVSGLVTDETEIECEGENEGPGHNEGPGDNEGPGGDDGPGDDDGPGGDDGPGDDEPDATASHEDGDEDEGGEGTCTSADLLPDAVVHEAELELTGAGAVFEEIELAE